MARLSFHMDSCRVAPVSVECDVKDGPDSRHSWPTDWLTIKRPADDTQKLQRSTTNCTSTSDAHGECSAMEDGGKTPVSSDSPLTQLAGWMNE